MYTKSHYSVPVSTLSGGDPKKKIHDLPGRNSPQIGPHYPLETVLCGLNPVQRKKMSI